MRKYVLLVVTLAACARDKAPRSDTPTAEPNATVAAVDSSRAERPARRIIVFAGTSLTAGLGLDPDSAYPEHVQRLIDSAGLAYEVVNAGVSGETSSALLARLDWLLRQPFAVFVIETGANDGLRGIPVTTMRSNIERAIERVRQARPDARIALVKMEAPPNMGAVYTREFRRVYPEVAAKERVPLLPFLLDGVAGRRELNQGDGIHPNYAGSRILAKNVWRGLRPLLQ